LNFVSSKLDIERFSFFAKLQIVLYVSTLTVIVLKLTCDILQQNNS